MRADRSDPVIRALRKFAKLAKLEVELADGQTRALALSERANKWEQLSQTLGALEWRTVTALDSAGAVLGVVTNEEEEEEDDDEQPQDFTASLTAFARILASSINNAMTQQRAMFQETLRGYERLIEHAFAAARTSAQVYQNALRANAAQEVVRANEGETEEDSVMNMMKMAAMLKFMPGAAVPGGFPGAPGPGTGPSPAPTPGGAVR